MVSTSAGWTPFADPYEGSKTQPHHEQHLDQYGKTVVDAAAHFSTIHSLKRVMVNCWHMNTVESEGMWRLYVNETSTGVCTVNVRSPSRLRWRLGELDLQPRYNPDHVARGLISSISWVTLLPNSGAQKPRT
jgi:hypothetical protein